MKKVEFINEEENENYLRITEDGFLKLIEKNGIINTIREYDIPEEFILKHYELIDKNIIISALQLSEDFINSALTLEYFENSDILNLNMRTYSNLSDEFIQEYNEYINWERMIVYLSSSDKIDVNRFKTVIDRFDLWNLISANELPIDFIRENASKLNWEILSIVNCFTEEEKEEFSDFIPEKKIFNMEEYEFKIPTVKDIRDILKHRNYTKEELSKKIEEESKAEEEKLRFEVKHKVENLTKEDLIRLREMLNN